MTRAPRSRVPTDTRNTIRRLVHDGYRIAEIAEQTGVTVRTIQRIAADEPEHVHDWIAVTTYNDALMGLTVVQSCKCGDVRGVANFPVTTGR